MATNECLAIKYKMLSKFVNLKIFQYILKNILSLENIYPIYMFLES